MIVPRAGVTEQWSCERRSYGREAPAADLERPARLGAGVTTLLWLRDDLRTVDHEALTAACSDGGSVVALWIREVLPPDDADVLGARPQGAASRWWYHRSLEALRPRLEALGVPLVFAAGDPRGIIPDVAAALGAGTVRWSRRYASRARALDAEVKSVLRGRGHEAHSHPGALLVEPWQLSPAGGGHYSVFTPFHRAAARVPVADPLDSPTRIEPPSQHVRRILAELSRTGVTTTLGGLGLLDRHPEWWRATLDRHWEPGEQIAHQRLASADAWLTGYRERRDLAGEDDSTSHLSPYLRTGEVSPRTLVAAASHSGAPEVDVEAWIRQLYWREFSWHLTYHLPDLSRQPLRAEFEHFPWRPSPKALRAWREGRTGVDMVDAGMLQLWHTGWMHNRVRMVTASLLTKNLLQPWWHGEKWFWDTLVDADEANNPVSWQWVSGCGADAAPYFRVFNPELQQQKFDPARTYVDRWLAHRSPGSSLALDLQATRRDALDAYAAMRSLGEQTTAR